MTPTLSKLALGATTLAISMALLGLAPGSAVFAQTAAPSATAPLPQSTIQALQEALNRQGAKVAVDGMLNEATRAAIREYQSQHHLPVTGEPDQATLAKLGVADRRSETPAAPAAAGGAASDARAAGPGGMGPGGMMGPGGGSGGMMGSGGMAGMMGEGGMAGMMGMMRGQGPHMGQMPMAGACPMMQPGMSGAHGLLYGMPAGAPQEMTPERVSALLQQHLAWHGNPRLKLGPVVKAADGNITAEIVTTDGSLVQKLAFNRYPGLVRQVTD
jgi:peptidoglycan hydrolase-like protein with peptidoglycan-binding domain